MKAKDLVFRLKSKLFKKFRCHYCKKSGENALTTYLWSKVEMYDIVSLCKNDIDARNITGLTISSVTLYFLNRESADERRENFLSQNERYIPNLQNDTNFALVMCSESE